MLCFSIKCQSYTFWEWDLLWKEVHYNKLRLWVCTGRIFHTACPRRTPVQTYCSRYSDQRCLWRDIPVSVRSFYASDDWTDVCDQLMEKSTSVSSLSNELQNYFWKMGSFWIIKVMYISGTGIRMAIFIFEFLRQIKIKSPNHQLFLLNV